MSGRIYAIVESKMLIWTRKNAGYSIDEVAKKLQTKPETLASWEDGESYPTINQLRKLGRIYKRPIAFFYLSEPPREFGIMRDFRRLPGQREVEMSPVLRFAIRQAHYRLIEKYAKPKKR